MIKQIGWFILKEDKVFTNHYETAAWYEDVLVKAGQYPMKVPEYKTYETDNGRKVSGHIDMIGVRLPGIITADDFQSLFYGVPVGAPYNTKQNAGKESSYYYRQYLYAIASRILNREESLYYNPDIEFELLPEYEAREIHFEWDGEPHTTWGIFERK